nr:hypothetical protein [Tanacetum cinerariifolium]
MENYKNVSQDIRDQLNAKAEAVQIILTGINNDIYSTVDVYSEFRKFTSRDGESLESYYSRFYKMMNELVRNQCDVTNHQVNVQFLLQLQPEWQRDDTDDEPEDQELEAHYMYMAQIQEVIIDSLDMSYDREQIDQNDDDDDLANERDLLASLIEKLKCEIDDSKNRNKFLETSNKVLVDKLK